MNSTADTTASLSSSSHPTLPALLAWPAANIPSIVHSTILAKTLNMLLTTQIREREFDFLDNHVLVIKVRDAQIGYRLRYKGLAGFTACRDTDKPDLTISGTLYDFLTLATRREDSDTLFFNRRVVIEGNTALGLELKNWLDGMDFAAIAQPVPVLMQAANSLLDTYERFNSKRKK